MALATLTLIIAVLNSRLLDSLEDTISQINKTSFEGLVSVLVPASNEESRIGECLNALTQESCNNLEILILDDESTDSTAQIIESHIKSDPRMRIINGTELPDGWIGKHWACEQLFRESKGDIILFMDADTILSKGTISASIYEFTQNNADLLTIMPRRIANCITEKLVLPFIDWIVFSWMPMKSAKKKRSPYLSATFGQFMLFKRESYELIGRHAGIRNNPLDDFSLGRISNKLGLNWVLLEGATCIKTLGYAGNIDAFKGISRSVFPALNYHLSIFVVLSITLLGLAYLPLITLINDTVFSDGNNKFTLMSTMSLSMIASSWIIACRKFKHSIFTVLFYPLSITLIITLGLHSIVTYLFRATDWKKRTIKGRRIRL